MPTCAYPLPRLRNRANRHGTRIGDRTVSIARRRGRQPDRDVLCPFDYPHGTMYSRIQRGLRVTILALAANVLLGTIKLIAGLIGHSYALVADAVESFADCISSIIVWGVLTISA